MVYRFKGSHMGSHVGFRFLVSLYHWLCSSFVLVEGDRDGLIGGGWMYTCRCGWWWKMFVMVW